MQNHNRFDFYKNYITRYEMTRMPKKKIRQKVYDNLILYRRSLIYQTKEFFHNSTLHGVRYIVEPGRPNPEKFMWFCFVACGTVAALVIIMSLWEKFQTNPTITGLDTDVYTQSVIYPTIVICPLESYDETILNSLAYGRLANYDENAAKRIEMLLKLLPNLNFNNLEMAIKLRNELKDKKMYEFPLRQLVFQIAIKCENVLIKCYYRGELFDCCKQFLPIYTENGYCYAFNSRFVSFADSDDKTDTPANLHQTDKSWALFMTLNVTVNLYILPYEEYFDKEFIPKIKWQQDETIEVRIARRTVYTTDEARQLTINQRKCIFHDEIKLKYFPDDYTFTSCMKECRMTKAKQFCKCLPPFYKPIGNTPICTLKDFDCLDMYNYNISSNMGCNHCELSCSATVYLLQKIIKSTDRQKMSGLSVEFLTWPIMRYRREVLFGWVDLLVSFGGIAGLFLGFSLLSGVEIIYYFTLRAFCMFYKDRQQLYEMEERIKNQPPPPINMKLNFNSWNHRKDQTQSFNSQITINNMKNPPNYFEAISTKRKLPHAQNYKKYSQSMFIRSKVLPSFSDESNNNDWQYNYLP